jgi:hypothetical protein
MSNRMVQKVFVICKEKRGKYVGREEYRREE